jgi:hypothetical protein
MSAPIGARQDGCFKAVSMAPSFNLTPVGPAMQPLPYPTVSDLSNSIGVAGSVRFNGKPVYTMASSQPDCKGDEQGSGGGVRSGTVNGEVKPTSASGTVKVEGKRVVRDGDTCTMNGGNNTGIYTTVPAPSTAPPGMAAATSNPPVKPETPQEKSSLRRWLDELRQEVQQAAAQPLEGLKGAVKGVINIPSNTVELLAKAAVEQHATELSDAAITASALGQAGTAKSLTELAAASREQAARIDVPKLGMSNQAQQGGDVIATAVGVFAGGVGLAKAGVKAVAKMGVRASKKLDSAKISATKTGTDGVRIVGIRRATVSSNYKNIVNQVNGKIIYEADAMNPGILGDGLKDISETFSGGRYATIELNAPLKAYRVWTPGQSREFGAFWSLEEPVGSLQSRIDSALLPEWGAIRSTPFSSQASQYTIVEIPSGSLINIGEVSSQGGAWVGGKSQLLIDGGAQPEWKISEGKLK